MVQVNSIMAVFEIGLKSYYYGSSEWSCDYIEARDEQEALRKFAKQRNLDVAPAHSVEDWSWSEGDYFVAFKYIKPVALKNCSYCNGSGVVSANSGERMGNGGEK